MKNPKRTAKKPSRSYSVTSFSSPKKLSDPENPTGDSPMSFGPKAEHEPRFGNLKPIKC